MTVFLTQHAGTILVSLLVVLCMILAVWKLIRDKKNGRSVCGNSCNSCPHSGTCHKDSNL
ncbi:MAG: FeoB-associated Cys-rich membrane protein [Lachnospiraceae bacterium]|nr:FeoB-associated Cys-rich membrane protein [Lachnospiraceae bacterium]